MNKEEIYNFCKKIVKKENIDFKYIKFETERSDFNKYAIENYIQKTEDRLFIRAIVNNKIGSYSVQDLKKEKILDGIKKAKEIARLNKSEVKYKSFGEDKSNKKIKFDNKIKNIDFKEILEDVKNNLVKEKYITGYQGDALKVSKENFYINPYTEKENKKDYISVNTSVLTKNKKKSDAFFSNVYTRLEDIDIQGTFNQAKINALNLLDPQKGEKGEYTLIFTPEVSKEIFRFILNGTSADAIEKKTSFFNNIKGKEIFSKKLTILEKPHIDYFLSSEKIDDEGFKTSQKDIIKNGVFRKPIYDLYSSLKYNKKPTGNGFLEANYNASYTNKIQVPGTQKIEDIISKTKKGILVYNILGLHTNKLTTGDFAITISSGKLINNGDFEKTITNLNFAGNFKEIFKNAYFSREQLFSGNSLFSFTVIPKVKLI